MLEYSVEIACTRCIEVLEGNTLHALQEKTNAEMASDDEAPVVRVGLFPAPPLVYSCAYIDRRLDVRSSCTMPGYRAEMLEYILRGVRLRYSIVQLHSVAFVYGRCFTLL